MQKPTGAITQRRRVFRKHGYREQMIQGYLPSPNEVWPESFEGIKFSLLGKKKEIGSLKQISKEEERTSTCDI